MKREHYKYEIKISSKTLEIFERCDYLDAQWDSLGNQPEVISVNWNGSNDADATHALLYTLLNKLVELESRITTLELDKE